METRKTALRRFLLSYLRSYDLQDEEDIFALGFVNSMIALQLVDFVEKNFGVTVDDDDLDLDNFRSLSAMDRFVARKVGNDPESATGAPVGDAQTLSD